MIVVLVSIFVLLLRICSFLVLMRVLELAETPAH